jgi:sec-independent protein translocase protein TatA
MFGLSELAIILIVVIAVLGAKKLPDLVRSAGKSARILKSEARAMKADGAAADGHDQPAPRTIRAASGDVISSRTATEPAEGAGQQPQPPA